MLLPFYFAALLLALGLLSFLGKGAFCIAGHSTASQAKTSCGALGKASPHSFVSTGEPLDFLENTHRTGVFPLMYCHIQLKGQLNPEQLKGAVSRSVHYVPEILCAFDSTRNRFVDGRFDVERVFSIAWSQWKTRPCWDLYHDTQLKISMKESEGHTELFIAMSHLLTDGEGFKQYLYLLSDLYNGAQPQRMRNQRSLIPFMKKVQARSDTQQRKQRRVPRAIPLLPACKADTCYCLNETIDPHDLHLLHAKTKACGATLNDAFMAAYARVAARLQGTDTIVIPCPADLRRFSSASADELSIANLTGIYKILITKVSPEHSFQMTLRQVHVEMSLQKEQLRCFSGLGTLVRLYSILPANVLKHMIRAAYRLPPVSYTNTGVIDGSRLCFSGCHLVRCYLTGSFRSAPYFQLSISTFHDVCNLNCTLIGDDRNRAIGQSILSSVKAELLAWIQA